MAATNFNLTKKSSGKVILGTIQLNRKEFKKQSFTTFDDTTTKQRDSLDAERLNKFKFYKDQKAVSPVQPQDHLFSFMKALAQRHCE